MTYDLNHLYFFAKVIENVGFSATSSALGMAPSQRPTAGAICWVRAA